MRFNTILPAIKRSLNDLWVRIGIIILPLIILGVMFGGTVALTTNWIVVALASILFTRFMVVGYIPYLLALLSARYGVGLGFTLQPAQGTVITIMKSGAASGYFANIKNRDVNRLTGEIDAVEMSDADYVALLARRSWLQRKYGIIFIGMPFVCSVRTWEVSLIRWNKLNNDPQQFQSKFVSSRELFSGIPEEDTYGVELDELNTMNMSETARIRLAMTLKSLNAEKMQFATVAVDHIQQAELSIGSVARDLVANTTVAALQSEKHEGGSHFLQELRQLVNEDVGTNLGMKSRFGMEITQLSFILVEYSGLNRVALMEAAQAATIAEGHGKARVIGAQRDAEVTVIDATAEAKRIELITTATAEGSRKNIVVNNEAGLPAVVIAAVTELAGALKTRTGARQRPAPQPTGGEQ